MKKYLILFVFFVLLGCSKKTSVKSEPEPDPIPKCQVTPTTLDFGYQYWDHQYTRSFNVKNIGAVLFNGTLKLVDESDPGVFTIPEANRNYTLYPGQSFDVIVTFHCGVGEWNATIETGNSCCPDIYCHGRGHW
jgi:hypothetical protein